MCERWSSLRSDQVTRAEGVLVKVETFVWLRAMYVSTKRTGVAVVGCRRHRRWWEFGFMLKELLRGNLEMEAMIDVESLRLSHHKVVVGLHVTGFLGSGKEYGDKVPQCCRVVTSYWMERATWLLDDGHDLACRVLAMLKDVGRNLR